MKSLPTSLTQAQALLFRPCWVPSSSSIVSLICKTAMVCLFDFYIFGRLLTYQTVVAMTETGDVKQSLPVIDQSNLWNRLKDAFESGRGSLRVLVVSDHGDELAVDLKVIHGSSL